MNYVKFRIFSTEQTFSVLHVSFDVGFQFADSATRISLLFKICACLETNVRFVYFYLSTVDATALRFDHFVDNRTIIVNTTMKNR